MSIGRIIRQLRDSRGLSTEDLAKSIGVNSNVVKRIEGHRRAPKHLLPKIAEVLEVDVSTLYSMVDMEDPAEKRVRQGRRV